MYYRPTIEYDEKEEWNADRLQDVKSSEVLVALAVMNGQMLCQQSRTVDDSQNSVLRALFPKKEVLGSYRQSRNEFKNHTCSNQSKYSPRVWK
jgi:hypothetical protein